MPNERIYYIPPRFLGDVRQWPSIIDHVADMNFNAIWFSPFFETTAVTKDIHGVTMTGSYYAIRNHFRMDMDYSTGSDADDRKALAGFCAAARAKGIRIYTDMVCNHIAADHPLVRDENIYLADIVKRTNGYTRPIYDIHGQFIGIHYDEDGGEKTAYFRFKRNADLSLEIPGPAHDPWSDVAPINYASPEALRFFVTGDDTHQGYFKKVIDWHIDLGFTGFRCDAAYLVPPHVWQELIGHAHTRTADAVFMAETLGGPQHMIGALGSARITDPKTGKDRAAFDFGMLGTYWWNFEDPGLPFGEAPLMHAMSHFGGVGNPDNHDTDSTLATALRRIFNRPAGRETDEKLAAAALRDYAVCVLACAAGYMQMGFEYANEKQNHVFRGQVTPADWKNLQARAGSALDLTDGIKAINDIKAALDVDNCRVHFKSIGRRENDRIIRMDIEYIDVDTHTQKAALTLFLNRQPENGAVTLSAETLAEGAEGMVVSHGNVHALRDVLVRHTPVNTPIPHIKNQPPSMKAG